MSVRVTTHEVEFLTRWHRATVSGLDAVAKHLWAQCSQNVNVLYPPASKPGEAPRRRSGDGRRSIFWQTEQGDLANGLGPSSRVGTSGDRLQAQGRGDFNYMAHWERNNRAWLLPTFVAELSTMGTIFEATAKV